ncbi:MAG: hypothetical protein JWM76_3381 [Pseudonocardiales bacterium]|nr:hypothetical protein [Pseudonocardiales bacterium]
MLLAGELLAFFRQVTDFRKRLFGSLIYEGEGEALDGNNY